MMRKLVLAALLLAPMTFATAMPAAAKVNFDIYFGVPHYDYRVGPDYRFRPGYGWYRESYRNDYRRNDFRGRLSCREARQLVRDRGFRNVTARDCDGRTYTFRATRANGRTLTIFVDSRTGAVRRG